MKSYAYMQFTSIPGPSAHSIFVVKTAEAASKLGYAVTLVSSKGQETKSLWDFYQIKSGLFSHRSLAGLNTWWRQKSIISVYVRILDKLIFSLRCWWWARSAQIQILQTADIELVALIHLLWPWYQPQIIYDAHLPHPYWVKSSLVSRVSLAVVTTGRIATELTQLKLDPPRILQLPMGFEPTQFRGVKPPKLSLPDKPIVGYIGRFETLGIEKGIRLLLQTLSRLKSTQPVFGLIIGGPESLVSGYQAYATKLGLDEGDYRFISSVPSHQVGKYIAAFDIAWMVYPAHPHFQLNMSPMKLIEYMASSKPVITSNFPSISQLVSEKEVYLVDPDNPKEIVQTLSQMICSPEKSKTKVALALDWVQQFTWVKRQELIFSHVVSGGDQRQES